MSNYQAMLKRIKKTTDMEALRKVEASLERLYKHGFFTAKQLTELDHEVMHRGNVLSPALPSRTIAMLRKGESAS